MIAVFAPLRAASIAARNPAPPAPITTTSYSCFVYVSLISSPHQYKGHVTDVPFCYGDGPKVAKEDEAETCPEPKSM